MKEYIKKEIKPGIYEYGYLLQKLDIKLFLELGIKVPKKIIEAYEKDFDESRLKDYVYFNDPKSVEFISRQYYLRDIIEFSSMNLFELELLLNVYDKRIKKIRNKISLLSNKDRLLDLTVTCKILENEMQSLIFYRDNLIESNNKVRK